MAIEPVSLYQEANRLSSDAMRHAAAGRPTAAAVARSKAVTLRGAASIIVRGK